MTEDYDSGVNVSLGQITRWERFGRRMFRIEKSSMSLLEDGDAPAGWTGHMIEIRHVRHAGQYVYGDVRIYAMREWRAFSADPEGFTPHPLLARPSLNLTSSRTIKETAKAIAEIDGRSDIATALELWNRFFEELCILVLDQFEAGGTLSTVGDAAESHADVDYLFEGLPGRVGLVPDKTLSCIMAHGGQGKTMMADLMTVAMITGQPVGPFNPKRAGPVLVCDWELTRDIHDIRVSRICDALGLNVPKGMFHHYKPLNQPLDRVIDTIIETVMLEGIKWVWIDSIGPAAAGELNSSEVATRAINCLKEIPVGTTFLAHLSKQQVRSYQGQPQQQTQASPIGSQFFWNGATAIYELKQSEQLAADGGNLYTLANVKANLGEKWQRPLGYKLWFEPKGGAITCSAETITGTSPGGEAMPLQERIRDFLQANGKSKPAEIALALALTTPGQKGRVLSMCEQMAARGLFEKWDNGDRAEFALAEGGQGAMPKKVKETPQAAFPTVVAAPVDDDTPRCFCDAVVAAYLPDGTPVCSQHMGGMATG